MARIMCWMATATACLLLHCSLAVAAGPLKVFILAGQSNMQGHARLRTIDYISKSAGTAAMYHDIIGPDGKPRVYDQVWITYFSQGRNGSVYRKSGPLTTGFGASDDEIGPELTFGIYMYKQLGEPILIIKTAWGGTSLNTDFRPPSGGPYQFNETQLEQFKKQGKDLAAVTAQKAKETGHYYKLMIQDVKQVLADPKKYCPQYDPRQGYELAGFVWFQGWNDLVDRGTYPHRDQPGGYDLYTKLMGDFIRDVRSDLQAPHMPFVIGVLGVGGKLDLQHPNRYTPIHQNFRNAMAAVANLPEFKGTVVSVPTADCWDPLQDQAEAKAGQVKAEIAKMKQDGRRFGKGEENKVFGELLAKTLTPAELDAYHGISNQQFHYMGSAKILGCIGRKFAEALGPLVKKE